MTIQDFQNINSYHKITAEVFEFRLFKNYLRISVSIGTSAKCRSYTVLLHKTDTLFFQNQSQLFVRYAQFFHFMLFLLSKIVFYGEQKLKGKRVFRKIEIIHVRLIVSSVGQK